MIADLDQSEPFLKAIAENDDVAIAFIVTDEDRLFESLVAELPDHVEPVRLYEAYLRNFEIEAGEAPDEVHAQGLPGRGRRRRPRGARARPRAATAMTASTPSVSLSATTGAGKTVMAAAVIEALFCGSETFDFEPDPGAVVIWFSDDPNLNEQTRIGCGRRARSSATTSSSRSSRRSRCRSSSRARSTSSTRSRLSKTSLLTRGTTSRRASRSSRR